MTNVLCVCASTTDWVPEQSLHALTTHVVDESLGLTCAAVRTERRFSVANCGIALASGVDACWGIDSHDAQDSVQLYHSESELVVFYGKIENLFELHKYTLNCAPGSRDEFEHTESNDAEMIARLYHQRKFHFIASLKGQFSFVHFSTKTNQVLAARDATGRYPLFQGTDKATGGLVVSDMLLASAGPMREIPAGTFIFGSSAYRDAHKIGSAEVKPVVNKAASVAAALRALNGLSPPKTCNGTSVPAVAKPLQSRTTPSHMTGKSDTFESWRRAVEPQQAPGPQAVEQQSSGAHHTGRISARATTTPSHKGTADRADVWRSPSTSESATSTSSSRRSSWSSTSSKSSNNALSSFSGSSRDSRNTTPSAYGTADRQDCWRNKGQVEVSAREASARACGFEPQPRRFLRHSIDSDMLAQALARATSEAARPVQQRGKPVWKESEPLVPITACTDMRAPSTILIT
mmetsp:Transcript_29773/g.65041  ORF Transcript_29773/g.65041 Transcript_29773/m.65041 type:complete len:463 (-) Transcript_29773:372-1760(-)|eukprot:CAMPEP_0118935916 /NCGR_PEP_ID=MMETSP1169-20130426/15903_1 /TAXON_ID=36882 /ORGANISM="Pyramimonas obovata, Strain CCMP722" /LENGTH=462 /DNA_ID=CAMNT_0006878997 /DNA_START=180 /DNA_END=1568 /DNA_ORIENTATION=+